jgi:nitroreductase
MKAAPIVKTTVDGTASHCDPAVAPLPHWRTSAKRILPAWIQDPIRAFMQIADGRRLFYRDYARYLKNSGVLHQDEEASLRARITATYHVVEKGLSHHNPRPGFGRETATVLALALHAYRDAGYPTSCSQYQSAIAVLACYLEFQHANNTKAPDAAEEFFQNFGPDPIPAFSGGYVVKRGEDLVASWRGDFRSLAMHRHSIRHFAGTPVSEVAIQSAVDVARRSPSACNRQAVRVHVLKTRRQLEQILELQGGARGFIELIDKLLIVTADLRAYSSFAERHLAYVDGGLFAMTLMYALCYEGVGSCPLHMALSPGTEDQIRRLAGLIKPEATVVMLAVGNPPEALKVAHSQRKPLDEYLLLH